ncbi:hypothetical protein MCEMIH16_02731 [Caulobacteraceae bacterium]
MNEDNLNGTNLIPGARAFGIPDGWVLDMAVQVDDACPGFLALVCRARLIWRQALWAALAAGASRNAELVFRATGDDRLLDAPARTVMTEFGLVAPKLTAREVIEASYGDCPQGWLGALGKLQGQAFQSPESYAKLFRLYSSDDATDRKRRAVLDQCSALDDHRLEAILALTEPGLMAPAVLARFARPDDVRRFEENVAHVRRYCSWVTDTHIREAVANERERRGQSWLMSLMARADKLIPEHHPCDADSDLSRFPVCKAADIGREHRNCLSPSRVLPQAASGVWTIVVWRAEGLLIETRMLDTGGWQVQRIHATANMEVGRAMALKVRDKLAPLGVACLVAAEPSGDHAGFAAGLGGWDQHMVAPLDFWD